MQLTSQDKKAAREGFAYVVVRGGKRVCYTSTLAEAKRECGSKGKVVSISGMRYTAQNPSSGAKQRARGTRSYGKGLFIASDLSARHARMLDKAAGIRRKSAMLGPTYTKLMHRDALAEAARVRNPSLNVRNPRAAAVDTHAVRELVLYTENDYHLWERRMPEFAKNLAAKIKRGQYDAGKAVKLIEYLTKEAADKYSKEYGGSFSVATRRAAAEELLPAVIERTQYVRNPSLNVRNPAAMTKSDKAVIIAFTDHRPASGKKLSTDGNTLNGHWMGGDNIAHWRGDKIHFTDLGSVAAQRVQRAVAKEAPRNWLARNPSAAGVGHAVGKHTKYAARGAARVGKKAWAGTKSFFGGFSSGFKEHNPSLNVRNPSLPSLAARR